MGAQGPAVLCEYLHLVVLSIHNDSCDLLIKENEDGGQEGGDDSYYNQPPGLDAPEVHQPFTVWARRLKTIEALNVNAHARASIGSCASPTDEKITSLWQKKTNSKQKKKARETQMTEFEACFPDGSVFWPTLAS